METFLNHVPPAGVTCAGHNASIQEGRVKDLPKTMLMKITDLFSQTDLRAHRETLNCSAVRHFTSSPQGAERRPSCSGSWRRIEAELHNRTKEIQINA